MQDLIVYAIVAAAAFYLVNMLWGAAVGKKGGCNGCGSKCASKSASPSGSAANAKASPLIQIEMTNLSGLNTHSKK